MNPLTFCVLLGETSTRTYYELARLNLLNQWWHWLVLVAAIVGLVGIVCLTYHRDTAGMPRGLRWLLAGLRIVAFVGLFIFFLQLEKRVEHKVTKHSRAVMLIDTSQSMGLSDVHDKNGADTTRIGLVADSLENGSLIDGLRKDHDVAVYKFDQSERPAQVAVLPRLASVSTTDSTSNDAFSMDRFPIAQGMARIGFLLLAVALIALLSHFLFRAAFASRDGESWALLIAVFVGIVGTVTLAVGNLRYPDFGLHVAWKQASHFSTGLQQASNAESPSANEIAEIAQVDWREQLKPAGVETRLGDAIQHLVESERGGPLAGVVVVTDGNQNAGVETSAAIGLAQSANIKLFPIGSGSAKPAASVRVVDVEAPARVYPADSFTIKAFVQAFGWQGRQVEMSLYSRPAMRTVDATKAATVEETLIDKQMLRLGADGEPVPIEFELTPKELGKYEYVVRVTLPGNQRGKPGDLEKVADVQVVDRKNKVLLFAGGPTREYRFVRVLCYRDKEATVDVHLQGALAGMAQEADHILDSFPSTADELFEYDCIVAFDPDWQQLSDEQIELLDRWISEKAGGLITIAGSVYTPEWTTLARSRRGINLVKGFYPVSFYRRSTGQLTRSRSGTAQAWPLQFSSAGEQARHLWLAEDASESQQIWNEFDGVYSYFPVRATKPGATVFASFSDPNTEIDGRLPVLMAGQFYGAGRVFYLGGGEMWRLRAIDPTYFETFYTKLIRHVSEGRLLRDSSRGLLLVSKDRSILGETIVVRATLTDEQYQPLEREQVEATLIDPKGHRQPMVLSSVDNSGGMESAGSQGSYSSQFTAVLEGDYRIELPVPDSETLDILSRTVRVRVPDREVESPQRNDALLNELATATGGTYFTGLEEADPGGADANAGLLAAMVPQDQETYIPGTPDRAFQQRLMTWLMGLICGALCVEWTLRRLNKLA